MKAALRKGSRLGRQSAGFVSIVSSGAAEFGNGWNTEPTIGGDWARLAVGCVIALKSGVEPRIGAGEAAIS
jgi:hypothetical protein